MQGRRVLIGAAAALAAAYAAATAFAGPPSTNIDVLDDEFVDDDATQILHSTTYWFWDDTVVHDHNVREDSKLFNSGELTDDPGTTFQKAIPAGKFHYYCELHGDKNSGMDGVVKVAPILGPPVSNDEISIEWGDEFFGPARYTVQYRVGNKDWKVWLKRTTKLSGDFGAGDKPVDVKPGKTYKFRARTEKANNADKVSGYSPAVERFVEAR